MLISGRKTEYFTAIAAVVSLFFCFLFSVCAYAEEDSDIPVIYVSSVTTLESGESVITFNVKNADGTPYHYSGKSYGAYYTANPDGDEYPIINYRELFKSGSTTAFHILTGENTITPFITYNGGLFEGEAYTVSPPETTGRYTGTVAPITNAPHHHTEHPGTIVKVLVAVSAVFLIFLASGGIVFAAILSRPQKMLSPFKVIIEIYTHENINSAMNMQIRSDTGNADTSLGNFLFNIETPVCEPLTYTVTPGGKKSISLDELLVNICKEQPYSQFTPKYAALSDRLPVMKSELSVYRLTGMASDGGVKLLKGKKRIKYWHRTKKPVRAEIRLSYPMSDDEPYYMMEITFDK